MNSIVVFIISIFLTTSNGFSPNLTSLSFNLFSNSIATLKATSDNTIAQEVQLDTDILASETTKIKTSGTRDLLFHSILLLLLLASISALFLTIKRLKKANLKLKRQKYRLSKQKSELEKANEKLLKAKEKTDLVNELKNQFLANMSHEIRTPLSAISSYAKLLMPKLKEKENQRYLHNILTSSDNMIVIVNDLLDFSNIESGIIKFESIPFNPMDVVTETITNLKIKAEEKNIALEIHLDPQIPDKLIGDPQRLAQILTNLINNAIKFSYNNSTISIDAGGTLIDDYCKMEINISDKGIGIENEKLNTIFNSFEQANSSTVRNFGGTGLGLTIVKRLVDLQKGDIWVKSKINEGTTFTVVLNFNIPDNNEEKPDSVQEESIKLESPVNILLVEDNFLNQEIAKDIVQSWGEFYKVSIANNGEEAIKMINDHNYSLVLMDIQMPIMDGHTATIKIRKELNTPKSNIPIIGMTAHAYNSEKELALKNGMDDYIIKPFNPDELKQKITYFASKANH